MRVGLACWAMLICLCPAAANAQATFTPLGDMPGGVFSSTARGISPDGLVVVGGGRPSNGHEAFRWTANMGMVGLGDLPGGIVSDSIAIATSGDGTVVVGAGGTQRGFEAIRWTATDGMVGLGYLGGSWSVANGVSIDGSVVVGFSNQENDPFYMAFQWTANSGMAALGDLPGGQVSSTANDVSADGLVVVGESATGAANAFGREAFRWTEASGMVSLGDLGFGSDAFGTSADGSVVVGYAGSVNNGSEAFRWTADSGMVGLGDFPGGRFSSIAFDVSNDGSVVVGAGEVSGRTEAFYWTEARGMVSLRELLVGEGASNLAGWSLLSAADISADGLTIVGYGLNPAGNEEAWVARIPESGTWVLAAVAGVGALLVLARRGLRSVSRAYGTGTNSYIDR